MSMIDPAQPPQKYVMVNRGKGFLRNDVAVIIGLAPHLPIEELNHVGRLFRLVGFDESLDFIQERLDGRFGGSGEQLPCILVYIEPKENTSLADGRDRGLLR
jgi:hypothetical protein